MGLADPAFNPQSNGPFFKTVKTCAALHNRFNLPEYQWMLTRIRQLFTREETAKKKGGGSIGKKRFSLYDSLGEKNLFSAQRNELIQRFDLNKESWLAEEIVKQFNQLRTKTKDKTE